jgi:DNA-binding NarL/FixJ family response regulator
MDGSELIAHLKSRKPHLEILVLTIHDAPKRIFEALEAGASGYLVKPSPAARILEAIQEVFDGGSPMSAPVARVVIRTFHQRGRDKTQLAGLTRREAEVLHLLSQGMHYKEIAARLGISPRTVGGHLQHIYEKLHVHSATEALVKRPR